MENKPNFRLEGINLVRDKETPSVIGVAVLSRPSRKEVSDCNCDPVCGCNTTCRCESHCRCDSQCNYCSCDDHCKCQDDYPCTSYDSCSHDWDA